MPNTTNKQPQSPRPQIFLDINGVVETTSIYVEGLRFNPSCVAALNTLIDQYNPEIIITSSWRIHQSLNSLREWFKQESVRGEIIDVTPFGYNVPRTRGKQIQAWRNKNNANNTPMLVLEDFADIAPYDDFCVITNSHVGLTAKDVKSAINILNKQIATS
jgi:hypothetical protein